MDNPKTVTCLEWCAGYAGIHLGLKRAIPGLRTIAYGEIEAFAVANLVAKMEAGLLDPAPVWPDIKTFPCEAFRDRVDILVAGYPCQPFSAAGKRQGADDPRHLWPHIRSAIGVIRPRACFFENVEGHISLGLSTVISDLEEDGYRCAWGIFSASEVGAPHQRKRVFILAHRDGERGQLPDQRGEPAEQVSISDGEAWGDVLADAGHLLSRGWPKPTATEHSDASNGSEGLGNSLNTGMEGPHNDEGASRGIQPHAIQSSPDVWPSRPGEPQHGWEPPRVVGNAAEQGLPLTGGQRAAVGEPGAESIPERSDQGSGYGQVESEVGGDSPRSANRLDATELHIACDNRTDELRLLGNGVVPATAERAWRVLSKEFLT